MSNDMPTPTPHNALRAQMVNRAVTQARDGKLPITVRNVSMFLPGPTAYSAENKALPDFLLDAEDLAPFLPPTISAETLDRFKDVELVHVEPTPAPVVESPQVRYQKLEALSLDLERERNDLKFQHQTAIRDEVVARNELDQIARAFLAGMGKPQTHDELLREHARSEAERRRAIAAGEIPAPRARVSTVGPSVVDRFAAAQRGGRAGFAGRAYARGALSNHEAARQGYMTVPDKNAPKALPGSGLPQVTE
jgi:hypothetical protein